MLEELSVRNIALIDRVSVTFVKGMNCLSGETGAGKSILAGALGLIRGNKAEPDLIRTGEEEGSSSAVFLLASNSEAAQWLRERDLDLDDGRLVLRRVLRRNGKGSIYIQGQPSTLKDLTELSALLFDMHGQHEHQNLFVVDNHRLLLDRFGGLEPEVHGFYELFAVLAGLTKKREQLLTNERELEQKREYLSFAIKEISEAKLVAGEEDELEKEKRIVSQAEKLFSLFNTTRLGLSADEGGGLSLLFSSRHALSDMSTIDTGLSELSGRMDAAYYELEDIARSVQAYQDTMHYEPARLEEIEDRLALIGRLRKKYGQDIPSILAWAKDSSEQLNELENLDSTKLSLQQQIKEQEEKVFGLAATISGKRKQAALRLKRVVEEGLSGMGMAKAKFEVQVQVKESERGTPVCGPWGYDAIEFLMSANPGEPLKPIRSVASGGELSRVMLAIKAALSDSDRVETLVFDEVDTGIGGEVAVAVGDHLKQLAKSKQILAITHLASIAVRADNHCKVEKSHVDGRTLTDVRRVTGADRIGEIARMLSGDSSNDASLRHAEELLSKQHAGF